MPADHGNASSTAALCIATVLLNAYCAGADMVERCVNYQTWPWIAGPAFARYHRAQTAPIARTIVLPPLLCLLSQWLLMLALPQGALRVVVIAMLAASVAGILSTVLLQVPIHRIFSRDGYSPARMRRLLRTDGLRKGVDALRVLLSIRLLWMLLRPS